MKTSFGRLQPGQQIRHAGLRLGVKRPGELQRADGRGGGIGAGPLHLLHFDKTAVDARALHKPWAAHTDKWLRDAGPAVAFAANSAACLLDLDGVIIDGSFSRDLLHSVMAAVNEALDRYNWEGVSRPQVLEGTIGSDARAMGGALLPLYANFAPDRDLFLKLGA